MDEPSDDHINQRILLVALLFSIFTIMLYFLWLDLSKYSEVTSIRAQAQQELYLKLENYTCLPKEKGCYYGAMWYSDCSKVGVAALSLVSSLGNQTS